MEEGRVVRVGPKRDVRAPAGAPVTTVDYGDATILPGLVDAHTHLVAPGDGTRGDDIAKEDDDILLLQAAQQDLLAAYSGNGGWELTQETDFRAGAGLTFVLSLDR
jgi:imidazolonepropionase-like amidohydrolase